jgi:glycosyltransferase A (GT-A) superfamily protein (DUF2064 family)
MRKQTVNELNPNCESMKNGNVICILATNPKSGKVKVDLECLLGNKNAGLLARALLLDVIATALKVPRSDVFIAYWPAESKKDFDDLICLFQVEEKNKRISQRANEIALIPQNGQSVCQRLSDVSQALFGQDAKRVIFICSDNPLLDPMILKATFELLKDNSFVLGPTFEGGYYLLGLNGHYPEIFEKINWKPGSIYKQLRKNLDRSAKPWQELEISYEIDFPEELEQLYSDIDNLRLAGNNEIGCHTEKCLANLKK